MKKTLLLALLAIVFFAHAAAGEIPVYPGAKLEITKEMGNTACCPLTTRDPFDKVVAFYEKAFKAKAMDMSAVAAKYPVMKKNAAEMKRQAPPGFKFVGIPRGETVYNGQKFPQLFEITYFPSGEVNFVIDEEDLGQGDAKLVYEFRKKTGQMREPVELAYEEWFNTHRLARQADHVIPVYPGSYIDGEAEECSNKSCCSLSLLTTDPVEKVAAFYRGKGLKEVPHAETLAALGEKSEDARLESYEFDDTQFEIGGESCGEFCEGFTNRQWLSRGKKGDVNRHITIMDGGETGIPVYPLFNRETRTRTARHLPTVGITLESQVLDGVCVKIPKGSK